MLQPMKAFLLGHTVLTSGLWTTVLPAIPDSLCRVIQHSSRCICLLVHGILSCWVTLKPCAEDLSPTIKMDPWRTAQNRAGMWARFMSWQHSYTNGRKYFTVSIHWLVCVPLSQPAQLKQETVLTVSEEMGWQQKTRLFSMLVGWTESDSKKRDTPNWKAGNLWQKKTFNATEIHNYSSA